VQQFSLKAISRTKLGKGAARQMRNIGQIPAVIYSAGQLAENISIITTDLEKILHKVTGKLVFLSLIIDQKEPRTALLKKLFYDNMGKHFIHVDLYEVNQNQKITINVPLEYYGEPKGINMGGILNIVTHSITLYGLLENIPSSVIVNVDQLEINQNIYINDLSFSDSVKAIYKKPYLLASCNPSIKVKENLPLENEENITTAITSPSITKNKGKKNK